MEQKLLIIEDLDTGTTSYMTAPEEDFWDMAEGALCGLEGDDEDEGDIGEALDGLEDDDDGQMDACDAVEHLREHGTVQMGNWRVFVTTVEMY